MEGQVRFADTLSAAGERDFCAVDERMFYALEIGDISLKAWNVWLMLNRIVDYKTGICCTFAPALAGKFNSTMKVDDIRESLRELEEKHYIRRFMTQGKQGNYQIFMHGYTIRSGDKKGFRLDALATTNPNQPVYGPVVPPLPPKGN
jgi:hypothetical protein